MSLTNLRILFQPAYLFDPFPNYDMKFMNIFLVLFVVMIALAIAGMFSAKKNRKNKPLVKFIGYSNSLFTWGGIVGLLLLFFRYEGVPYFSMRFILILWLVIILVWGIFVGFFYKKKYKKELKELEKEKEKQKYFKK